MTQWKITRVMCPGSRSGARSLVKCCPVYGTCCLGDVTYCLVTWDDTWPRGAISLRQADVTADGGDLDDVMGEQLVGLWWNILFSHVSKFYWFDDYASQTCNTFWLCFEFWVHTIMNHTFCFLSMHCSSLCWVGSDGNTPYKHTATKIIKNNKIQGRLIKTLFSWLGVVFHSWSFQNTRHHSSQTSKCREIGKI